MQRNGAEFVQYFVSGVSSTFEAVLSETPERGQITAESSGNTCHQVNVIIGVTGEAQGHVILGMSLVVADKIASAMMGQRCITFDAMAASAICELTNLICGSAVSEMAESSYVCDLTPPTIIRGVKVNISSLAVPTVVIPMKLTFGEIALSVALRSRDAKPRAA